MQVGTRPLALQENLGRCGRLARKAARRGARVICTPECMLDGYAFDAPAFQADPDRFSLRAGDELHARLAALARELDLYLLAGASLRESGPPAVYRNAILLFGPGGEVGRYFKVHSTYGNLEATFYQHGEEFPVFDLVVSGGTVRVGVMICYDRQVPEAARVLRVRGAEVIFNPAATGNFRRRWNTRLLRTRGYENKCYVVSVNHARPRSCGRSLVVDPHGKVVTRLGRREQARVVTLDLTRARAHQHDLHTRRPSTYAGLLEPTCSGPEPWEVPREEPGNAP